MQSLGVELVGQIPKGLPPLSLPDFSLLERLWPGAFDPTTCALGGRPGQGLTSASTEASVGLGSGVGDGEAVGVGVGVGVALGVGRGVGVAVADGVGRTVGVAAAWLA